jgi:hypothetical protein
MAASAGGAGTGTCTGATIEMKLPTHTVVINN